MYTGKGKGKVYR